MKKFIILILFSFFLSIDCFSDQNFVNIHSLLSEGKFEAFTKIELENTDIVLIGKPDNKKKTSSPNIDYKYYYLGQIYILAIDNQNGLIKSYVTAELNGSAHECYFNKNEFIIQPHSRSEIKGSREIILYDSKYNLFKIFTSKWMNLSNFYIYNNFIISNLHNSPQYKYYIVNKLTGSQEPLRQLEEKAMKEFEDSVKVFVKRNIYEYPY